MTGQSQTPAMDEPTVSLDSHRAIAAGDVVISCEPWVWSFRYKYHESLCAQCFRESASLRTCSGCKFYRFCSTQCQTINWKHEHRHECDMLKRINEKLRSSANFHHDCYETRSGYIFGCCSAEILMAKVINKILREQKELKKDFSGNSSTLEIIRQLPSEPVNGGLVDLETQLIRAMNPQSSPADPRLCELIWPSTARKSIPNLDQLARKVYYNAFPIQDQRGKHSQQAVGIFRQALHRSMIPICWDMNVTMDMQGRKLVVRATENIPKYNGLNDLRHSELFPNFATALIERRKRFKAVHGHPCGCGKCTPEYEAEITPLKCITPTCSERIPSDQRALRPCPQCGALNGERLKTVQEIVQSYIDIDRTDMTQGQRYLDTFRELEAANVVYPDAHFRFVCGFILGVILQEQGEFQEAFELHRDMIICVRTLYPTYHVGRASYLVKAGAAPHVWAHRVSQCERSRLNAFFADALPTALGWLMEAKDIYRTLGGEDSVWAQEIGMFIEKYGPGKVMSLEEDASAPVTSLVNWDDLAMISKW